MERSIDQRTGQLLAVLFGGLVLLLPQSLIAAPDGFWKYWGDGNAEVAGYALSQPRYGQMRAGRAVMVFVTETFSETAKVKADPGKHAASDEFPVLKVNLMKEFQTGIYDYNVMISAFARVESRGTQRAGSLAKLTFSSQEWCGHVFEELFFEPKRITGSRHSYFDGEGTVTHALGVPDPLISADELPVLVRHLLDIPLKTGEKRSVHYLPSLTHVRLLHRPLAVSRAILERSAFSAQVSVPASSFQVEKWDVKVEGGVSITYYVEETYPHRIIKWETSDGEVGQLLGSSRMKYWEKNKEGDESLLEKIGVSTR